MYKVAKSRIPYIYEGDLVSIKNGGEIIVLDKSGKRVCGIVYGLWTTDENKFENDNKVSILVKPP